MKTNREIQHKWLDIVFDNIEKLESKLIYSIENQSFDENSLNRLLDELRMSYGAIDNLKKSFTSKTFFTGYVE